MKLLKEKYKTYENARKRRDFENALARSEFERGYKAHMYHYTVVSDENNLWRVQRERDPEQKRSLAGLPVDIIGHFTKKDS